MISVFFSLRKTLKKQMGILVLMPGRKMLMEFQKSKSVDILETRKAIQCGMLADLTKMSPKTTSNTKFQQKLIIRSSAERGHDEKRDYHSGPGRGH